MTEQRLKVESGPPQHVIDNAQLPPVNDEITSAGRAKEKAQEAAAPAQEKAQEIAGRAQEAAAPAKEKVQQVAEQAKQQAHVAAGQAKDKASAQVDEKSTQVGQQIGSQGEALDGVAGELRKQGKDGLAQVAEQAAEKVKNVGGYLEQADGEQLVAAAQKVAQENPAAAAAVGAAAGFAAGRVLKASQPEASPQEDDPAAPGS